MQQVSSVHIYLLVRNILKKAIYLNYSEICITSCTIDNTCGYKFIQHWNLFSDSYLFDIRVGYAQTEKYKL